MQVAVPAEIEPVDQLERPFGSARLGHRYCAVERDHRRAGESFEPLVEHRDLVQSMSPSACSDAIAACSTYAPAAGRSASARLSAAWPAATFLVMSRTVLLGQRNQLAADHSRVAA